MSTRGNGRLLAAMTAAILAAAVAIAALVALHQAAARGPLTEERAP